MVDDDKHTGVYGKERIFVLRVFFLFAEVHVSFYSWLNAYLEFRTK